MILILMNMFFWIGLVIFAYLFEKVCVYIAEERKYKNMKVVQTKHNSNYDYNVVQPKYNSNYDYDDYDKMPTLEDVMFDTGLSEEELDEILPDYNMDLEDFD